MTRKIGAIPAILTFILGFLLMLPSIADVGQNINENLYDHSSKDSLMTRVYNDNKQTFFFLGLLIILADIVYIWDQIKRGNWL